MSRCITTWLFGLILFLPVPTGATVLLDISETNRAGITARFLITSNTLLRDDQGAPRLTIADQLLCTLTITAPEEMTVTLPSFSGPSFGDFTLLDQGESRARRTTEGLEHERQWLIEPFNPGPYLLPELLIRAEQDRIQFEMILPRPELTAQGIKDDGEDLDDILPTRTAAAPAWSALALAGLLLAALVLGTWLLIRLKNKSLRPVPPKARALAEIATLTELPPRQQVERLSFTLRCYLASRFGLHCLEQTNDEYSPELTACEEIPPQSRATFLAILQRCDLIRFSNLDPRPEETASLAGQLKEALSRCPTAPPDDKTCGRW